MRKNGYDETTLQIRIGLVAVVLGIGISLLGGAAAGHELPVTPLIATSPTPDKSVVITDQRERTIREGSGGETNARSLETRPDRPMLPAADSVAENYKRGRVVIKNGRWVREYQ